MEIIGTQTTRRPALQKGHGVPCPYNATNSKTPLVPTESVGSDDRTRSESIGLRKPEMQNTQCRRYSSHPMNLATSDNSRVRV